MTAPSVDVIDLVRIRADQRCEYCRMHQSLQGATFHVEHIVPQSAGGTSDPENLAIACPSCNLQKSDRASCVDPLTGNTARLFHPRRDP
ncbi:MAG: HNH endonuclease [Planctomycetes bacterium]|nr:HNH endonuclease [Planctomycetota bacterium]